jgi:hypothetical protein
MGRSGAAVAPRRRGAEANGYRSERAQRRRETGLRSSLSVSLSLSPAWDTRGQGG